MGAAGSLRELLGSAADRSVGETGASVGAVYLLSPHQEVLRLTALSGLPAQVATHLARLPLADPIPPAEAARERRLVWVHSQTELVRRYPRAALVMPYDFALAAAPVTSGPLVRGVLVLLWPAAHPYRLSAQVRDVVSSTCRRVAALLDADEEGSRELREAEQPVPGPPRAGTARPEGASAAEECLDRLPEGYCSLDTGGRVTFVSDAVADLVGRAAGELCGATLWEALPWLEDPGFVDRYRAAAISRRSTSVTVERPGHQQLDVGFHPDSTGVSLRLTPADGTASADRPPHEHLAGADRPGRAGSLYDVLHLAASLTEAVGVQDVVELASDRIMPAFGAQGFVLSVVEAGKLHIVGHRGYRDEVVSRLDHPSFRDDEAPTVRALTTASPLFFVSPEEMARFNPDIPRLTERAAWAFLPLIVSGHPVGCCVLSYDRPRPFDGDERAVLTSLAALLAQALDRARLYDAEHQLAQELQTALLPASLPRMPGLEVAARYLPTSTGMDVGGDFYDLIRCGETTVAATIGDVQGHSVTAAALMGQVRTGVHATAGAPCGGGSSPVPTASSPTSTRASSQAASTSPSTSPAAASTWRAPVIRRRCCATPTGAPRRWSRRPDCCSASIRPPSTRPPRSPCRRVRCSPSTPTGSSRPRAPTSTTGSPISPAGSRAHRTAPWTTSPTRSSARTSGPTNARTTSPCSSSVRHRTTVDGLAGPPRAASRPVHRARNACRSGGSRRCCRTAWRQLPSVGR